ncbi:MAG: hypothetical protein GX602_06460, partial [Dehalococcoidales bacterium]|nr:hypothetical protein [Dehalococcoidales bacterium]
PEEPRIAEAPILDEVETQEMKKARLEALEQMFSEIEQTDTTKRQHWDDEE